VVKSAKAFFRGPVWVVGGLVGFALSALGFVQLARGQAFWMWLFLAAVALVGASFYSYHRSRVETEKAAGELPNKIEELIAEGMEARGRVEGKGSVSAQADLGGNEAFDYFEQAQQLLIGNRRRSFLPDLTDAVNEARRQSREAGEKKSKALAERAAAGEHVAGEQMHHFFLSPHREALAILDGTMHGLSNIRKQLGS
jgi:hypothetical protein